MDKKKQISFKLDNEWSQVDAKENWSTKRPSLRSPSLPFSHFQKRRKRQDKFGVSNRLRFPSQQRMYKQIKSSSKFILTIGSAVILGLVMGLLVLNFFSKLDDSVSPSLADREGTKTQVKGTDQGILSFSADMPTERQFTSSLGEEKGLGLPARTYFVVQAGAFSEKQMAEEGLKYQQQQGWAGLLLGEEAPYRLYAGLAATKEGALLLGQFYREKNMDIYVKEHQTVPLSGMNIELQEDALASLALFLQSGEQLLAQLSRISSTGIINSSYLLEENEWQSLQEIHRTMLQEAQTLFATSWPESAQEAGEAMAHHLTEGMNALDVYQKQKHLNYLWKVQQSLLHYLEAYEQLLAR